MNTVSFDELYAKHKPAIYNRILYMMRDVGQAEDLTQETFLKAWLALPSLKYDGNIGGWLYTIATHLCLDILGKARYPTCSLDEAIATPTHHHGDTPDAYVDRELYVLAWQRLNICDRQVLADRLCGRKVHRQNVYRAKQALLEIYKCLVRSYEVSA